MLYNCYCSFVEATNNLVDVAMQLLKETSESSRVEEAGHMCPARRGESQAGCAPDPEAERRHGRCAGQDFGPGTSLRARQEQPGQKAPAPSADRASALCHCCQHRYFQETQGGPCSATPNQPLAQRM